MSRPDPLIKLIEQLQRLPGIGAKSAQRLAFHVLKTPREEVERLADAMREVWKKYPKDPDVGAFFAEAMMNLRPWDQWTPDGKPQPGTDEIIATLDAVLKLNPNHPLAKNH